MKRLVFRKGAARDQLLRFFFDTPFTLAGEHESGPEEPDTYYITWTGGRSDEARVTYVDDRTISLRYFVMQGSGRAQESRIEARLRNGPFDLLTDREIVHEYMNAKDNRLTAALAKLVLIAPEKYNRVFGTRVKRALNHKSPKIRAACIGLVTYMLWPELKPSLERLANDVDAKVREDARIVLNIYHELAARSQRPARARRTGVSRPNPRR